MIKKTKNDVKFDKLLKLIFNLKVKLYNTAFEPDIVKIDQKAKALFEIYNNGRTLKEAVNTKIKNLAKQNAYLKYEHFVKKEKEKS